jgi:hypothetical protein
VIDPSSSDGSLIASGAASSQQNAAHSASASKHVLPEPLLLVAINNRLARLLSTRSSHFRRRNVVKRSLCREANQNRGCGMLVSVFHKLREQVAGNQEAVTAV